ncbi:MAG: hypothetical protein U5K38_04210 [Woeseiaceae bacterium]|nr:hypothetical protein [Woeseiaceae bacterium]
MTSMSLPISPWRSGCAAICPIYGRRCECAWRGQNDYDFGAANTINASIAADFRNRNPGATDAEIAANAGPMEGFSGSQNFEQLTLNVDFAGKSELTMQNPVYLAFGAEYRDEDTS